MIGLPNEGLLDIRSFEKMLDYKYLTNSYKLYFFYGIFKEVLEGNDIITFERLTNRMISISWYPVVEYHLNFGVQDKLNELINYLNESYKIEKNIREDELLEFLENLEDDIFVVKRDGLCNYVPYRLLTPFFSEELRGLPDHLRNQRSTELSNKKGSSFYKINNQSIEINAIWLEYIDKNQNIINGWLMYKLVYFLQKKNPNVPAIPFKLSPPRKRNLTRARNFWRFFIREYPCNDIYSNNQLFDNDFSVDHFIPWSFVLHDEAWNLVPTFKTINSSKNDRLPKFNIYYNQFYDIQYRAYETLKTKYIDNTMLQEYLTINRNIDLNADELIPKDVFVRYLKDTISPLYQIAINQGYELWEYNSERPQ